MNITNKKAYLLCVLDILKEYTDENHLLTQEDIMDKMMSIYGCECNRKTVGSNIQTLKDFGYDIQTIKNKGVFLGERDFEKSQVRFLIDAVFSSKVLSSKQAQELAKKLSNTLSKHEQQNFKYLYKSENITRTDNKQLFLNIDVINEAIEKGKQIEFDYNRSYDNKTTHMFKINPYYMINNQGKYYLLCSYNPSKDLANYKLEKISNVKITDNDIVPITKCSLYENGFDITDYINNNIYMFGSQNINAKLLLKDEYAADYVLDWFSSNTKIYKKDDKLYADIKANEQALIYWCLQYGPSVELLEPITTRQKLAEIIDSMYKKYYINNKETK